LVTLGVAHTRGYEVSTAATTQEATIQRYRVGDDQFDLVILDVHLRSASHVIPLAGYRLYQRWKQSHPTTPFLLMSDETRDRELIDNHEGGVLLLIKRFLIAALMDAVRRLCCRESPRLDASMRVALSL
jgi:DNA-binding response OmpR family regulator